MAKISTEKSADGTDSPESVPQIYQLKVSIAGAKPPIWRRVLVPSHMTLGELHYVLQALMGWQNSHLHQFEAPGPGDLKIKAREYPPTSRRFVPHTAPSGEPFDWMEDEGDESEEEAEAILETVVPLVKSQFLYTYDMGDDWEHDILVESILPADPEGVYPVCIKGARNGPVEDCGGIWGYESLLASLVDPKDEEHEDRVEWLEAVYGVSTWDGSAFDIDEINKQLAKLRPKAKRKKRTPPTVPQ